MAIEASSATNATVAVASRRPSPARSTAYPKVTRRDAISLTQQRTRTTSSKRAGSR
jgi:hypothetical protein